MLVGRRVLRFGFTNMLWAIGLSSADAVEVKWTREVGPVGPVGAGDGGTPKEGAVEVCGSPNPLEVAEWLPSNVWSA